jgi:membrane protease subunit HflK
MSLNDNGWGSGGRKGSGPPDLEELWRDFNRRLAGLFGRKGGGGGSSVPPLSPRQFGGGIVLLIGVALAVWVASGFYIVDASQRGIVLQFGRYKETTEPGLRWRWPYPFQTNELVNLSGVRTVEVGYRGSEKNKVLQEALMLTDDENIVSVQFAVQYLLNDPKRYLFDNRNPDDAVVQAAETAIREVVGKSKMDYVLYEGRDVIAANTQKLIQEILDRYATGIQVRSVTMQSTQPPEQVQAAFDDAVKAGQDRERQKNEGQAYANDVIPRARGTASRLLQEAEGYKQRVIANAEGDAARFDKILAEYRKAPEVMRSRLYIDTVQQILSNTSKVLVDTKGQSNLLNLPLDRLMQAAGAQQAAIAVPAPEVTTGTRAPSTTTGEVPPQLEKAPTVDQGALSSSRSRDALRSRDRGDR